MQQAFGAREDLHERAEVDDARDRAEISFTDLSFSRKRFDLGQRFLRGFAVGGRDMNQAAVFDIDLGAGFVGDFVSRVAINSRKSARSRIASKSGSAFTESTVTLPFLMASRSNSTARSA